MAVSRKSRMNGASNMSVRMAAEERTVQALFTEAPGRHVAARAVLVQGPVRQAADAATGGHQLHHHHGQLGYAHLRRLHVGGVEEAGEDVETIAFHRIGDQGFPLQVLRDDVRPTSQGMLVGHRQQRFVGEQWHVGDAGQLDRVGGHHQVEVTAGQGRQRREGEARGQVQFDFRPGVAELVDGRHQPLEATVAFDGHVQASGGTAGEPRQVALGGAQLGQQRVGQLQQAQPGAGEAYRLGLAHEQLHAQALFQFLELVRQRRLGKVQALGGFHQAVGFAQRVQGLEVAKFEHGGLCMSKT